MHCQSCDNQVDSGYRFCPVCGASIEEDSSPSPLEKPPTSAQGQKDKKKVSLTLIDKGGKEGASFKLGPLREVNHVLGRNEGDIPFPDDIYISPRHARVYFEDESIWIQDLSSLNGVYIRVRGSALLQNGDQFLVGEQILRFQRNRAHSQAKKPPPRFSGSNVRSWHFRIVQVLALECNGSVWVTDGRRITIGREQGTVRFSYDQFMSREHCRLEVGEQVCHLHDLQSRNGTYVRKYDRHILKHNDYFFVGQQLIKVRIR